MSPSGSTGKLFAVLCLAASIALAGAPARAATPEEAFVAERGPATIPLGHAQFCAERPLECRPNDRVVTYVPLTEARWRQLVEINAEINADVVPITDAALYKTEEYWTYPHGYGDCEDYVLAKRRALIELGWPASTVLVTVVRERNGDGHAVLTVRTDRGDLILDNQATLIKLWSDTPYTYIKRQSQSDSGRWVTLVDARQTHRTSSIRN